MKKTIAILLGGRSPEYDVSLHSAYTVIRSIDRKKFDLVLVGITREGHWLYFDGDIERIPDSSWEQRAHTPVAVSPDPSDHSLLLF